MNYYSHSDSIKKGSLFVCLPGGHDYVEKAYEKGACAHICLTRKEWAVFAKTMTNNPASQLIVIGITGTNGKTSVAHFVTECLEKLGEYPTMQGTLTQSLTTPDSMTTQLAMANHRTNGGTHFIMEVSSHAIVQQRVYGIPFTVKLLTNVSHDHLDYHGSFSAYRAVKYQFMNDQSSITILPDDYATMSLSKRSNTIMDENLKATKAILLQLGFSNEQIEPVLNTVSWPSGRMETIDCGQPFRVIVDFAHTPTALNQLLKTITLTTLHQGRVMLVFGCGGDRDKKKRPLMGNIAAKWASTIVITQDNPRCESPEKIVADIMEGIPSEHIDVQVIDDRRQAIQYVLHRAQKNDSVIVAGKGHERYQTCQGNDYFCHDQTIIKDYLKR